MTSTKRGASPIEPEQEGRAPEVGDGVRATGGDAAGSEGLAGEPFAISNLSGQTVGHYVVGELLGGGVMTSVYSAYDQIMEREVALKVLLPGADPITRERFRREARTVSTLEHPNIVRSYQVGQTGPNGITYIAMELVTGSNMADVLERVGKLSTSDTCRLLEPIARALDYAHSKGIVHRDVKPSNILLRRVEPGTPDSVVISMLDYPVVPLLSDFGIARALDAPELTSVGRTIGTPAFMSPEQCAGSGDIDGRSDIYSMGAVLYRCLVGRAPFVGTTTQILYAHVYEPLLIPDEAVRELPAIVVEVIRRAMMKAPEERYASARLMAADLATAAGQKAVETIETPLVAADPTRTMAALPAARTPGINPGQVLVPAPPVTPKNPLQAVPRATPVAPRATPAPKPRTRKPQRKGGPLIVAVLMVLVLATLAGFFYTTIMPMLWSETNAVASPTTSSSGVIAGADNQNTSETPQGVGGPVTGGENGESATPEAPASSSDGAAANGTPTPVPTPTPIPPPAVDIVFAWDQAQAFYEERDWAQAFTWLTLVRRADEGFEQERVVDMLVRTLLGLATEAMVNDDADLAIRHLQEAAGLEPGNTLVAHLLDATELYRDAEGDARAAATDVLKSAYLTYAGELAAAGERCAAAEQIGALISIVEAVDLLDEQIAYQTACTEERVAEERAGLTGSIIYSAQQGDNYHIFRLQLGAEPVSELIATNGSMPGLSPNGNFLAFFNRENGPGGLVVVDLGMRNANDRSVRSQHTEDSQDSPPAWDPGSNRIAFASRRFGDGRQRIYVSPADVRGGVTELGGGKDPAWRPDGEWIVYNGTDANGGRPGLWLMRADGSDKRQLTDNGNDQRPVWTPDGESILFMSNGRHSNWEVYRVEWTTGNIERLTFREASQDGLPAVSPDGKYFAYMSDEGGVWRMYYAPLEGGEGELLADIAGSMPSWLEHTIQWVP